MAALCKIGGIIDLSNESFDDSSINMTVALGTLLRDSLSRDLDLGLIEGSGGDASAASRAPGVAALALGADLLAQAIAAKGSIGDAGLTPTTLAIKATALAAEGLASWLPEAGWPTRTGSLLRWA